MLLAVTEDAPSTDVAATELLDGLTLVDLLERTGLAKSKKEARRTIDQGGTYVNNVQQTDAGRTLRSGRPPARPLPRAPQGQARVHIVRAT